MARSKPNPRYANGNARRKLRARVRSLGLPCALCGKPIDYSLKAGHPMSYELDEVIPVGLGGDPLDPKNVQPAHRLCNERKGASTESSSRGRKPATLRRALPQSREW